MNPELIESFRQSMRRFASTVSVVTCASDGVRHGITATAVTSVSVDPVSVLTCINANSSLVEPLMKAGRFCVNILHDSQVEISQTFGGRVKGVQRFSSGQWVDGKDGVPFLANAQANLFCRIDQVIPYGTHRIIIGLVEDAKFASRVAPLIYQNGEYGALAPLDSPYACSPDATLRRSPSFARA
jgi:flavin reductase